MIETHHLSKLYSRGVYALRDLSLTIDKGEFVFLTGPSGAGKSTLLRLLLREELPSEGRAQGRRPQPARRCAPSQVQAYRRSVGFVFQDFRLIPRKTVFENVAFVLRVLGVPLAQQQRKTFQVLKWVGLQHRMNALPEELSGGEQQRIAIARALVNDPQLILADEPTGNLDPDLSLEIMNLFREINARGTTVVVATHDRELIRRVGRRAITLDHGRVVEVGLMRALRYAFDEAVASLWRGRQSGLLSTAHDRARAVRARRLPARDRRTCERLGAEWSRAAEMSVYLERRRDRRRAARRSKAVLAPGDVVAGARVRVEGRGARALQADVRAIWRRPIDALGDNPLPASFEVRLQPGAGARGGGGRARRRSCAQMPGVADVRYDRQWLDRLLSAIAVIRGVGLALGAILTLAAALTVANVVRLALLRAARRNRNHAARRRAARLHPRPVRRGRRAAGRHRAPCSRWPLLGVAFFAAAGRAT